AGSTCVSARFPQREAQAIAAWLEPRAAAFLQPCSARLAVRGAIRKLADDLRDGEPAMRASAVQAAKQRLDRGAQLVVFLHELLDALLGIDDRRVVLAAELLADRRIAETGDLARQVHRHL